MVKIQRAWLEKAGISRQLWPKDGQKNCEQSTSQSMISWQIGEWESVWSQKFDAQLDYTKNMRIAIEQRLLTGSQLINHQVSCCCFVTNGHFPANSWVDRPQTWCEISRYAFPESLFLSHRCVLVFCLILVPTPLVFFGFINESSLHHTQQIQLLESHQSQAINECWAAWVSAMCFCWLRPGENRGCWPIWRRRTATGMSDGQFVYFCAIR